VRLRAPEGAGGGRDLIAMNDGYFEELEDVWEMNREAPEEIDEDTILVVWARTKDADTLNWVVRPGTEPEERPIMVHNGDANGWETYPVTATAFLAGLLGGDIDSPILSSGGLDASPQHVPQDQGAQHGPAAPPDGPFTGGDPPVAQS
jgi:hypothetical protein